MVLRADELDYLVEVFSIGVGDEYLSEVIGRDQFDDLFHPLGIELVENIVEQQDGSRFALSLQEIVLSQFQGNQVGFALPL